MAPKRFYTTLGFAALLVVVIAPGNHVDAMFSELDDMEKVSEEGLERFSVEELRAVLMRLAMRMRQRLFDTDAQQNEMTTLSREITQMQNMRR